MTAQQLLKEIGKAKTYNLGKEPVVVLSLSEYDEMREYLEMYSSKQLQNDIAKARKEKKTYSFDEVKKLLDL